MPKRPPEVVVVTGASAGVGRATPVSVLIAHLVYGAILGGFCRLPT